MIMSILGIVLMLYGMWHGINITPFEPVNGATAVFLVGLILIK